jgi:hypothetical protein
LRQWKQIREAIKATKRYLRQKISDEVFSAGKEIEAMKRLTLHRMVSLLYRFIASVAQI